MKTFTVNKVTYTSAPFTFGTIRKLESMGISLQEIQEKPMTMISAYLAICGNTTIDVADEQIDAHIISGGNFEDILNIIKDEMDESGFFQALSKTTEKTTTKSKSKSAMTTV